MKKFYSTQNNFIHVWLKIKWWVVLAKNLNKILLFLENLEKCFLVFSPFWIKSVLCQINNFNLVLFLSVESIVNLSIYEKNYWDALHGYNVVWLIVNLN